MLLITLSGPAQATLLNLPANPLLVSSDVVPNIMFMVDNSGSMNNVVVDDPYAVATNYTPTVGCPSANQVPLTASIDIRVPDATSGTPQITYVVGSTTFGPYNWGGSGSARCFLRTSKYLARLNAAGTAGADAGSYFSPGTYLPALYDGNFLNWYFNTSSVAGVTWNLGRNQLIKPLSATTFAQSRIQVARASGTELIASLDARLRVGLSTYNKATSGQGGEMLVGVSALNSTQRTALTTGSNGIANLLTFGNTPLGETLAEIGRYFATRPSASSVTTPPLTLHPDNAAQRITKTIAQAFPTNLRNASTTPPVAFSCQQNFAVLLTDGRPQGDQNENGEISSFLADYDGDCSVAGANCRTFDRKPLPASGVDQYESAGSDYLNDVAKALFEIDLRPDFPVERNGFQFKNNISTFMIGFADDDAINDPLIASTAAQGGGDFFAAENSGELATAFNQIVTNILERSASFSSASLNSTSLNAGSRLFQANFNSADWSGNLRAIPISSGSDGACPGVALGQLCPDAWNAGAVLNGIAPGTRNILTFNTATKAGIPLRWANLPAAQQALLNRDPNVLPTLTADTRGQTRLNYLRGDRSLESAGNFRARGGVLGDIVASDPVFVDAPNSALPFGGYSAFAAARAQRTPVIYVGANDGMLHGFRESNGAEMLAYVPGKLFGSNANPKLARLTAQPYTHVYGVDGSPSVADIQIGSSWATYLVGALRYGGQGIFALDVTQPDNFSESLASTIVKWEFTDTDAPDLGYTFSQPSIVKMKNGKWAAIIGNGYNSKEADGSASTTGQAALFIVFLDGPGADGVWAAGTEYLKIPVGPSGSGIDNGLATAASIDLDGDRITDYIFAGDLLGNLWQFNVGNPDATQWTVGNGGNPLFIARSNNDAAQPITSAPEVGLNLSTAKADDLIVYFGTGKYIEAGDNTPLNQQNQTFYGVFADPVASLIQVPVRPTRATLLRQTVLQEQSLANGNGVRVTSQNALDPATHKGWYIDLYNTATAGLDPTPASGLNKGERQISRPLLRDGRIVFTTLVPSDLPCEFGGSGWLMELDAKTGSRPAKPALDITNNLTVDQNDVVSITIAGLPVAVPVSGLASLTGTLSTPAVLALTPAQEAKYSVRSDGSTAVFGEAASGRAGRITWREILR